MTDYARSVMIVGSCRSEGWSVDVDSPSAELADLDAGERGDRESLLAQLAENVDTVFLLQQLDPRRYLYVNNAFERLTGHPRAFLDHDPGRWPT